MITENWTENNMLSNLARFKDQEVGGRIMEKAQKDFATYQEEITKDTGETWKLRNENLVDQIQIAKALYDKFKSSDIIEQRMKDGQVKTDHDEERILALCRAIETSIN